MPNTNFNICAKTASDIIKYRQFSILGEFKSSLQEHQKTIQKQEAKKERLMGPIKFGAPKGEKEEVTEKKSGVNKRVNIRQRVNIKP